MKTTLIFWATGIILVTGIAVTIFGTVQQSYRQSANDPQIQLAEDGARVLQAGALPSAVVPQNDIDISQSLAPFVIVYNDLEKPLESSGALNGKIPIPPTGVFDVVRAQEKDLFSWAPAPGVRIAAMMVHTTGPEPLFILAGRSLRETENRIHMHALMVLFFWVCACGVVTLGALTKYFVVDKRAAR